MLQFILKSSFVCRTVPIIEQADTVKAVPKAFTWTTDHSAFLADVLTRPSILQKAAKLEMTVASRVSAKKVNGHKKPLLCFANKFLSTLGYEGDRCEICSRGYYGNPLQENGSCEPCNCNLVGSISNDCDFHTGNCLCKPGFTGKYCSQCEAYRHVIQNQRCLRKYFSPY